MGSTRSETGFAYRVRLALESASNCRGCGAKRETDGSYCPDCGIKYEEDLGLDEEDIGLQVTELGTGADSTLGCDPRPQGRGRPRNRKPELL